MVAISPGPLKTLDPPVKKRKGLLLPMRAKAAKLPRSNANSCPPSPDSPVIDLIAVKNRGPSTTSDYLHLAKNLQARYNCPGLSQRANDADPTSILGKVEEFAHWARSDLSLYHDEETTKRVNEMHAMSTPYRREKQKSIIRFYAFIETHPNDKIKKLAEIIDDPERIEMQERRLVLLVRGLKTADKQQLLNMAMTIFAVNMFKIGFDKELLKKATDQRDRGSSVCS